MVIALAFLVGLVIGGLAGLVVAVTWFAPRL